MSLVAYRWVWAQRGLTSGQRTVLLFLAEEHRQPTGLCCPGLERIAAHCELQPRWVQRCLRALEARGLLRIEHGTGRHHTNRYVLPVALSSSGEDERTAATPSFATPERTAAGAERTASSARKDGLQATRTVSNRRRTGGGATPPPPPQGQPSPPNRAADPHWEALVAACGEPGTDSERGKYNRALKELKAAGATAEEIARRAAAARATWRVALTPTGLAANWGALGRPPPEPSPKPGAAAGVARGGAPDAMDRALERIRAATAAGSPRPAALPPPPAPQREVA